MKETLERLNHWISVIPARIRVLSDLELSVKPLSNKWSKKEILGHLCDSALTNLQRYVRVQYEAQPYTVLKYAQNQWVELMDYQNFQIDHILNLWVSLNKQVAGVIAKIPADRLQLSCDIGEEQLVTLEWMIKDYVDHMEHHLMQIFHTL